MENTTETELERLEAEFKTSDNDRDRSLYRFSTWYGSYDEGLQEAYPDLFE